MFKWKTATLWAAILWALIFVQISVVMFAPRISELSDTMQSIVHLLILPLFILLCCYMYFKNAKPTWKDGLMLAIWFIVIGTILDLAITIPLFVKSFDFYKRWDVWIGTLEILVISPLYTYLKKK